jgi:hypothetical protein
MTGVEQVTVVVEGKGDARAHAMGTVAMALEAAGYVVLEGVYRRPAQPHLSDRLLKHGRREAAHSEKRLAVVLAKAAP